MRNILFGLLVALAVVVPAAADSDGYFCVGPDYLAMELRSFNTPGLIGPHVLKILHFEQDSDPRWAGEVIVEDFQPHRMTCEPKIVLLEGAGNGGRGWVYYTVTLGATGVPGIASVSNDPAHVLIPSDSPPNLGNWARPGIIPLRIEGIPRHFQCASLKLPRVRAARFAMTTAPSLRRWMTVVASFDHYRSRKVRPTNQPGADVPPR